MEGRIRFLLGDLGFPAADVVRAAPSARERALVAVESGAVLCRALLGSVSHSFPCRTRRARAAERPPVTQPCTWACHQRRPTGAEVLFDSGSRAGRGLATPNWVPPCLFHTIILVTGAGPARVRENRL
jgi:hypothetical protein